MLLVGQQEEHLACKKTEWWDAVVVICLGRGADHLLLGRGSRVLTARCFVYGNHWFSTSHKFDLTWPIAKKFVTGDYVGDGYPETKFGANSPTGYLGKCV